MKKPKRKPSDNRVAFNIRLPHSMTAQLDEVASSALAPMSRTQLIQRVLAHFLNCYNASDEAWPYHVAGHVTDSAGGIDKIEGED